MRASATSSSAAASSARSSGSQPAASGPSAHPRDLVGAEARHAGLVDVLGPLVAAPRAGGPHAGPAVRAGGRVIVVKYSAWLMRWL